MKKKDKNKAGFELSTSKIIVQRIATWATINAIKNNNKQHNWEQC